MGTSSKDDKSNEIWHLTADAIIDAMKDPDRVSPGWAQAGLRFLKDNGVQAMDIPNGKLEKMREILPFKKVS
jgi:hypothetical protein